MQALFPYLAKHRTAQWQLVGQSLDPVESISGVDTVVPTLGGRWEASLSFVFRGEDAFLEWQGFLAQMRGRLATTLVPVRSGFRPRRARNTKIGFCNATGFSAGETSEHWGVENKPITQIIAKAPAALRAVTMEVRYPDAIGLRPGHFFSIGDRLHRVRAVNFSRIDDAGRLCEFVRFSPPLREAVAGGTQLEVARPVCRMRFATETEGVFDQSLDRLPVVQVNFREAL